MVTQISPWCSQWCRIGANLEIVSSKKAENLYELLLSSVMAKLGTDPQEPSCRAVPRALLLSELFPSLHGESLIVNR